MKKNKENINSLIKRKNLFLKMKKAGIKRVNPESISFIENALEDFLGRLVGGLSEEMSIHGRKTLKKDDVENVLEKIEKKEESWEI